MGTTISLVVLTQIKAGRLCSVILSQYDMKIKSAFLFSSACLAVFLLSACGPSEKTAEAPAPSATRASSVTAEVRPTAGRAVEITANDAMKFNISEIHAKPGEALAVTLTNVGTVPKFSMGHNWVLLKEGTDLTAFTNEAMTAATTEYIPPSFKDRILASTKLLGPKESDTARFNAPSKPGRYPFLCAFPGHMQVGMKGELIVE